MEHLEKAYVRESIDVDEYERTPAAPPRSCAHTPRESAAAGAAAVLVPAAGRGGGGAGMVLLCVACCVLRTDTRSRVSSCWRSLRRAKRR